MNEQQTSRMALQLESVLGLEGVTALGRSTGFTKRMRKVTPQGLAVSMIGAMACRSVETIADLQRAFQAVTGQSVQYKPFHNQLAKTAFPVFMRSLFEALLGGLAVRTLESIPGHVLGRFTDIVLHDGSSSGLHEGLKSVFPGRFTNSGPAAVELHATMSLLSGQPIRVILAADSKPERPFLPAPEELRDRLFLADRGYMDLGFCSALAEAGASFIIRFSRSANPVILAGTRDGKPLPAELLGHKLKACAHDLAGCNADLDVEFKRGGWSFQLRLALTWNPTTEQHMLLATNLARADFRGEDIRCLYRLRWQVELLFKEWKSYANLRTFCTRNACIAEGLIWAALCAALLKRFLAHAAQAASAGVQVSTRTAAMALAVHLPKLLEALLLQRAIHGPLVALLDFLAMACRRAHPARDRLSGRLACGLRPTFLNAALSTCVLKD